MNRFAVKIQVDPYHCLLVLRPFVQLVPFIIPDTFREIYLASVFHQRLDVFVELIYARAGSCFALEYLQISRIDQQLKHRVTWIALICFVYLVASVSYSDFNGSLQIKRVLTLPSNLRKRLRGIRFCSGSEPPHPRSFLFGPPEQRKEVWPVWQILPLSTRFLGCPDHSCRCIPGSRSLARGWCCRLQTSLCGWWPHSSGTAAEAKAARYIQLSSLTDKNCLPAKNETLEWNQIGSEQLGSPWYCSLF